ncbi:hypothetical protein CIB95_06950 [Lottiidibacillus patelloidae]|uniref:Intracellular proteinase inhibitor BsuPI domain-containing protein n=1 Tax=Lottiidibacillus patelloidae TaxID=2670334 RepID=A0A263BV41_9BACI|nr:BsuPI-related putative proteinase inhibitor [Lottiidibacillus patelloidae]OZM57197.1 hypothetical protein CIB95_06950 [Lottiidibacillus patelloidae]
MKKYLSLLLAFILCVTLVACGSSDKATDDKNSGIADNENEEDKLETNEGNNGIIAGSIVPSATITEVKNDDVTIVYSLKNQTEKVKQFTFRTSQKFDYDLYSKDGKLIKRYSEDKDFLQAITYLTLKQGESYDIPIHVKNLKAGHYKLIIWLTAESEEDYKVHVPFEIPHN